MCIPKTHLCLLLNKTVIFESEGTFSYSVRYVLKMLEDGKMSVVLEDLFTVLIN